MGSLEIRFHFFGHRVKKLDVLNLIRIKGIAMPNMQKQIETFDKKNRLKLLEFIHDIGIKLHEHGDGTRINMNTLTPTQMTLITHKVASIQAIQQLREKDSYV